MGARKFKVLETACVTVITMDLHAYQIQGFFEKPVDHLFFTDFSATIES